MFKILLGLFFLAGGLSPPLSAADIKEVKIEIIGTSTVTNWKCEAKAAAEIVDQGDVIFPLPENFSGTVSPVIRAEVQVSKIDCKNKEMNGHLRTALKSGKHPIIFYLMKEGIVSGNVVTMIGELSIAGKKLPVRFNSDLERVSGGGLVIKGEFKIDMCDFGVEPPSLMFGLLKVGSDVTLKFSSKIDISDKIDKTKGEKQ